MKILHTSDWHIGHRLYEQSQHDEQQLFLAWLKKTIDTKKIDVLLISGDIFDTATPSPKSLSMYYEFLAEISSETVCKHVIVTGGNHDSPNLLNAPKEVLKQLNTYVVGKATDSIEDEVIELSIGEQQVIIGAVPYLRDQDIRRAVAGENFDEIEEKYKKALVNHYTELAEICEKKNTNNIPVLAMGHLFAIGGSISDSEKSIYVGNLGNIGADDFPKTFDYVALGHLHRAQTVGGKEHIRYSGSPIVLSFSEVGANKKVVILEVEKNQIKEIHEKTVPEFRVIRKIQGTISECITALNEVPSGNYHLTPFVEVVVDNIENEKINIAEISEVAKDLPLEILKISLKNKRKIKGLEEAREGMKDLKRLDPVEIFKQKCKDENVDLEQEPELLDAFMEIYSMAQEND